jgi:hypothetical protein
MNSNSFPIDVVFKDCYLSNNSVDSRNNPNSEIVLSNGTNFFQPVKGLIKFENLLVENAREGLIKTRKVPIAFKAEFVNCKFKIRSGSSSFPIFMETPSASISTTGLGGFTFNNVEIAYSADKAFLGVYGSYVMEGLRDVEGTFTIANSKLTESTAIHYQKVNKFTNVNINYNLVSQLPTGDGGGGSGGSGDSGDCVNTLNLTSNISSATTKEAAGTLTASNDVLHGSGTVVYKAGDKVALKPGFSMSADGSEKFKATIGDCTGGSSSLKARIYPYSSPSVEDTRELELETKNPVLYPNPVADHAELKFLLEEDDTVTINVYDAKYHLVVPVVNQQKMSKGEQNHSLDLSSLAQGLYFVSIEGANSEHGVIKLIKK